MGLGDLLRATMFGTLDAVANDVIRTPLQLPGHSSIWWMGILLVGKGTVKKFGSGILMGTIAGILAVALGMGKEGIFVFLKYFLPGLAVDLLAPLYRYKLESVIVGGLLGAMLSVTKLAANLAIGVLTNVSMLFLSIGLGYATLCHVFFGAVGGVLAAVILKRLSARLQNASQ